MVGTLDSGLDEVVIIYHYNQCGTTVKMYFTSNTLKCTFTLKFVYIKN